AQLLCQHVGGTQLVFAVGETDGQRIFIGIDVVEADVRLLQHLLDATDQSGTHCLPFGAGDLHRLLLAVDIGQGIQQADEQNDNQQRILPEWITVHNGPCWSVAKTGCGRSDKASQRHHRASSVPLGTTLETAFFCTRISTPSAISTTSRFSPTSRTRPAIPPEVMTSLPFSRLAMSCLCSFWRFICGRMIMKYMNTKNRPTMIRVGSMLWPPPPACA